MFNKYEIKTQNEEKLIKNLLKFAILLMKFLL